MELEQVADVDDPVDEALPLVSFRSPDEVIQARILLVGGNLVNMIRLRDAPEGFGLEASLAVNAVVAHPQGDRPCPLCNAK